MFEQNLDAFVLFHVSYWPWLKAYQMNNVNVAIYYNVYRNIKYNLFFNLEIT